MTSPAPDTGRTAEEMRERLVGFAGLPPIATSLGGVPFNGEHIAYWRERAKAAEAEAANLRDRVREAEKAMRPFAGSVFNDNGDVTISVGHLTAQDWLAARRFHLSLSPEPQEAGDHEPR